MSSLTSSRTLPQKHEPEVVTNWRAIIAGGTVAIAACILVGGVLLWLRSSLGESVKEGPTVALSAPNPVKPRPAYYPLLEKPAPKEYVVRFVHVTPPKVGLLPSPKPTPVAVVTKPEPASASEAVAVESIPPVHPRRSRNDEAALVSMLARISADLDLNAVEGTSQKLMSRAKEANALTHGILELPKDRPDLAGLRLNDASNCLTPAQEARELQASSRILRTGITRATRTQASRTHHTSGSRSPYREDRLSLELTLAGYDMSILGEALPARQIGRPEAVPALAQVLQAGSTSQRLYLVELLAKIDTPRSSVALAERAVFDLSESVRAAARDELKKRKPDEYRDVLLRGLRYPWAPIADHAADALVELDDRGAIMDLVRLLNAPDPLAPQSIDGKLVIPQLARINHLRNCLLCHAPSFKEADLVRAPIPKPGQSLPEVYYDGSRFRGDVARADVVYLRQDFSVIEPTKGDDEWPVLQRFDYVVRYREYKPTKEDLVPAHSHEELAKPQVEVYPQRQAVLFALRELTGIDAGDTREAWTRELARREPSSLRKVALRQ